MPLLDHFHQPLSTRRHWQGFHSAWINAIVQQLNGGLLPHRFHAEPSINLGGRVEIDVSTFEEETATTVASGNGISTAVWAPPRAPLAAAADLSNLDAFEAHIFYDEGGYRLAAAVELVSPANKDRPASRRAFAEKCAVYLRERVGVVVIDVVTERLADLHAELLEAMLLSGSSLVWQSTTHLSAIAYRTTGPTDAVRVEAWPELLTLGTCLPTVPLWISAEHAVPLDLEQSYTAACRSLRIDG
jgi:hypothetical protein